MADFTIDVPMSTVNDYPFLVSGLYKTQDTTLASIKSSYGSIIETCSKNSNVPVELITSMLYTLSNGVNNTAYKSNDEKANIKKPLVRSGVFSLSNLTARICLHNELFAGRLNDAERAYLNTHGNEWVKMYISETLPESAKDRSLNKWWRYANGIQIMQLSDEGAINYCPFNLLKPELSIAIGTIMIGQAWDRYSELTNKPIGSVIASLLLPYDYNYNMKTFPWNTSAVKLGAGTLNSQSGIDKLPQPNVKETKSPLSNGNVINPKGGWVGEYMSAILAKGGALEKLVKKTV